MIDYKLKSVDYIRREAAYSLAKKICDAIDSKGFRRFGFGSRILDWIDDLPAADVAPVVRCEMCDFWDRNDPDDGWGWCRNSAAGEKECAERFFCAYGAKMDSTKWT